MRKCLVWVLLLAIIGLLPGCATCQEGGCLPGASSAGPLVKEEQGDAPGEGFLGFLEQCAYNFFEAMQEVGR